MMDAFDPGFGEERSGAPQDTLVWRGQMVSRLVLGSAQLGMSYGIGNTSGKPAPRCACELVRTAWEGGVRCFDTAQAYGDSEAVLGRCLDTLELSADAYVISKLDPDLDPHDADAVAAALDASCERLRVDALWGMLLHRPEMLDAWDGALGAVLLGARDAQKVRFLGVSVYTQAEVERALAIPGIDLIQLPCNAWDQSAWRSGLLERIREAGKLPLIRSILLQGVLAMPAEIVALRLPVAYEAARRWHELAAEWGYTPLSLAIRFALLLGAPLVAGAERPEQIAEVISEINQAPLDPGQADAIDQMVHRLGIDEGVFNPTRWGRT